LSFNEAAMARPPFSAQAAAAVVTGLLFQCLLGVTVAQTQLAGHSFTAPPDIYKLAADWSLGGTVIPSTQSLVLQPGTPNRVGMLWSLYPLLTNDFEVSLRFTIKGAEKRTTKDEGFAFWYVYENVTAAQSNVTKDYIENQDAIIANTWEYAMQASSFNLLGYRNQFKGLGVVFSSDSEGNAVVSALGNDGKKDLKMGAGIPSADSKKFDRTKEVTVKIRVQKAMTKVEIVGAGTIELPGDFQAGGYIGMTAHGGKKGVLETTEKADFVELYDMQVTNYDSAQEGEKLPEKAAVAAPVKAEEKTDILGDSSSFRDHRAESDAIKVLTNMVFKLVVETQPMRAQLTNAIEALSKRITAMETTFENLKNEIDKKTGHHLGTEFEAIKKELASLSTVASKEAEERHNRLGNLHADIKDVHATAKSPDNIDTHLSKLTESNQRTLVQLTNNHQRMFGVSIAAIAFVIIAGLSLYNKFRCWEKKHVL
jgi:hypothetical protein